LKKLCKTFTHGAVAPNPTTRRKASPFYKKHRRSKLLVFGCIEGIKELSRHILVDLRSGQLRYSKVSLTPQLVFLFI
jgi:hypothetical protein